MTLEEFRNLELPEIENMNDVVKPVTQEKYAEILSEIPPENMEIMRKEGNTLITNLRQRQIETVANMLIYSRTQTEEEIKELKHLIKWIPFYNALVAAEIGWIKGKVPVKQATDELIRNLVGFNTIPGVSMLIDMTIEEKEHTLLGGNLNSLLINYKALMDAITPGSDPAERKTRIMEMLDEYAISASMMDEAGKEFKDKLIITNYRRDMLNHITKKNPGNPNFTSLFIYDNAAASIEGLTLGGDTLFTTYVLLEMEKLAVEIIKSINESDKRIEIIISWKMGNQLKTLNNVSKEQFHSSMNHMLRRLHASGMNYTDIRNFIERTCNA